MSRNRHRISTTFTTSTAMAVTVALSGPLLTGAHAPAAAAPAASVGIAAPARPSVPGAPSEARVRSARSAAAGRAADVAAAQHALDAAQSAAGDLDAKAELAAEAYNRAVARSQAAEAADRRAARAARAAASRREAARDAVSEIAAQTYRDGVPASLAVAGALLSSDGMQSAMERRHVAATVARHTASVLDVDVAAAAEARTTAATARSAAGAARQATAQVAAARADAQRQAEAEHGRLAALETQRQDALRRLAAAQRISVALAAARQQTMDEAAARAQAQSADATETSATGPVAKSTASGGAAAVGFARAQLGLPYVWGGAGPKSYDCSGLTMRAWARGGVALPHFAADQYSRSRRVGYGQLRPGDLVFWSHGGKPQDIYHVAIYIGGDKMIEAPHTGAVVKVADLFIMGTPDFYARP